MDFMIQNKRKKYSSTISIWYAGVCEEISFEVKGDAGSVYLKWGTCIENLNRSCHSSGSIIFDFKMHLHSPTQPDLPLQNANNFFRELRSENSVFLWWHLMADCRLSGFWLHCMAYETVFFFCSSFFYFFTIFWSESVIV